MLIRRTALSLYLTLFATALPAGPALASAYDDFIVADRPVLYLPLSAPAGSAAETDLSGRGHAAKYSSGGAPAIRARMPNGQSVPVFDGLGQYVEVRSAPDLSVIPGGALTVEAWIRPTVLDFPRQEGDGYVHWAGKGISGQQEYVLRMYSLTNSASRPNRISGYVFNPEGGLGSGSYFQDPISLRAWIHVAMVIDARSADPTVSLFKNGVLRKTTPLSQFDVSPQRGSAPLRIATRDLGSFFKGAIGKFAVYAYPLTETRLRAHYMKMAIWRGR
jgi:hypothetical protein